MRQSKKRRTISGADIIIFMIMGFIIFIQGYALVVNKNSVGDAPALPEYRMRVDMKSKVLKAALSACDWCDVSTNTSNFTIKGVDMSKFNSIINVNGNAKEMSEKFPEIYKWEQTDSEGEFVIKRNFKITNGGTVPVPTWLILSLIKNNVLTPPQESPKTK